MKEVKDNSSLPLLLTITGAVLVVVAGGWFFLGQEPGDSESSPEDAAVTEAAPTPDGAVVDPTTDAKLDVQPAEQADANVDVELRKARLAADAEIFVLPANRR